MLMFSLTNTQQHFGIMLPKINFQRNERKSFCCRSHFTPPDLRTVEQKFPCTFRFMIEPIGLKVLLNIAVDKPDLTIFDLRIGLCKRAAAFAQALHFASDQNDAALIRIKNFVIMSGLAVLANDLDIWINILIFLLIL